MTGFTEKLTRMNQSIDPALPKNIRNAIFYRQKKIYDLQKKIAQEEKKIAELRQSTESATTDS